MALSLTLIGAISPLMRLQELHQKTNFLQDCIELCGGASRKKSNEKRYMWSTVTPYMRETVVHFYFCFSNVSFSSIAPCRKCSLCTEYLSDDWRHWFDFVKSIPFIQTCNAKVSAHSALPHTIIASNDFCTLWKYSSFNWDNMLYHSTAYVTASITAPERLRNRKNWRSE